MAMGRWAWVGWAVVTLAACAPCDEPGVEGAKRGVLRELLCSLHAGPPAHPETPIADAGAPAVDASVPAVDAGASSADASAPSADASAPASDAGGSRDAGGAAPGPLNACCSTSSSGGCDDPGVAACVCEGDPFCCSTEYDALCVKQAVSRCGLDCDARPPLSDCCSSSDVPGCTDAPVAACICDIDPFCCVFRFDQSCVNLGVAYCSLSCRSAEAVP